MKRFLLIINCLLLAFSADAQYLQWNDLLEENSGGHSRITSSTLNSTGNIFCYGYFGGTLDLDPDLNSSLNIMASSGGQNLFFSSYGKNGEIIYGRHLWGKSSMVPGGLVLDATNNVFLSGYFNDTIDLNPGSNKALYSPINNGAFDGFIVKHKGQGIFQWARQLVSTIYTRPKDIALDQSGNIVVAGAFRGMTDFDGSSGVQNLTAVDQDIFIARYNANGNYINAIRIGTFASTVGLQEVSNLEIDASNNIYITGRFEGTVDFDPSGNMTLLTAKGKNDFYIAKYNSSLQLSWAYRLGGSRGEGLIDHKIYGNELWLAGSYRDTIDMDLKAGSSLHISQGLTDVFFAKYNLSANHIISKSFGGSGNDEAVSIEVFNSDSLFISGHFEGTVDFDPSSGSSSLTSSASKSIFFGSYDNAGDLNWISKVRGSNDVTNTLIRSNSNGNPYLFGQLKGSADFNSASPFSQYYTGPASFITKYGKCGKVDISVSTVDATCGEKDGSAIATVTGGTAPLRYLWTSGHITNVADSLRSGLYYLTVIDTFNCTFYSDPILINETGGPTITLTSKSDVKCNGESTGAIVLNVSGGSSPYTYRWSNGATTQSINGLRAGNYEITVTDDDGCMTHLRITINEPAAMVINPIITKPSCGSSNGSVIASVTGGSPTYSYSWLPSGSGSTLINISAGVYKVTVTDANSCIYSQSIAVSNDKAPDIFLDSLKDVSCGSGGGGIYISVYGGTPTYSYQWNPGGYTSQDISGVQPDNYELIVTDNASCKGVFVQTLNSKKPTSPGVCIADVDSINGNAVVVWEKPTSRGSIDFYNVFRETSTLNVFDLIKDSVDFTELSLYEDRFADTWTRPWSYKISLTDTCGVESKLSDFHTTIHNVITKNAQQEFNILWTPYKGDFLVSSYTLYRYTDTTGTSDSVTTVPSNIFSFTDVNSPSKGADVYYFVKVVHPSGCTATDAQNRNSSRSNRGSIEPPKYLKVQESVSDIGNRNLQLFPNPAKGEFNLELSSQRESMATVSLLNVNGREIWEKKVEISRNTRVYSFDIEDVQGGLYLVKVSVNNEIYIGKLMISGQ